MDFTPESISPAPRPDPIHRGEEVAALLAGSWRNTSSPLGLTAAQLARVVPDLLATGTAGLGWWRIRQSGLRNSRPARALRDAYWTDATVAGAYETRIQELIPRFRSANVEPILIKGWSVARLYPESGLRPYCDIDMCVLPEQLQGAINVLAAETYAGVELHEGVPDVTDRTWEELSRRSRLVPLGEVEVRVLGPEDQLRHLCLHLWRHHGFNPRWLCDLGVVLESLPAGFDWDYCLSGEPLLVDWIVCFLALAVRLLDARTDEPRLCRQAEALPDWLVSAILWKWGGGLQSKSLSRIMCGPGDLAGLTLYHWLDPIKASFRMKIRPHRPLAWIQLLGLLGRPYEAWVHLCRSIGVPLLRWRGSSQRFPLHLQRTSRFV